LKAVTIQKAFFNHEKTLFPLAKNNMKFQIHYSAEKVSDKVNVKEKNKVKNSIKKKGN